MDEENRNVGGIILRMIFLIAILIGVILFMKFCKLENIEVRSGSYYSEEEIKSRLITGQLDKYAVLFAYKINHISKPKLPYVEKVDVELVDKNSVIIYVYDKAIIGCVEHMGQYIYFDREGILVDAANDRVQGIPLIKGIEPENYTMNQKLELGSDVVFDTILDVLMLLNKNNLSAEDISFGLRNEITLHIDGNEILLGKSENYDVKINNVPSAIGAVGEGCYRFDFRNYSEDNREIDVRKIE